MSEPSVTEGEARGAEIRRDVDVADARRAEQAPGPDPSGSPPPVAVASPPLGERPEVLIGAAFAGAFLFAKVLKRLVD